MALNKKLIVLSGVGLVFTGVGAGVIGYKASQVADGQKQMDDSKASMGGQLSFGLASPLAGFAGTAGTDFMTNVQAKIGADMQRKMAAPSDVNVKGASYVNLSDQLQGDLITGVAHTLPDMAHPKAPGAPITNVGDAQSALKGMLMGAVAQKLVAMKVPGVTDMKTAMTAAAQQLKVVDHEIPNLRASDIRRLINKDLSDKRLADLGITDKGQEIIDDITNASVISLNVGLEDIIEAATNGKTFKEVATPVHDKSGNLTFPGLEGLVGGLTSVKPGDNSLMKAAINSVGNLNGALSSIRRINPQAKIALGMLGTYGVAEIDGLLGQINQAFQVAAMTQDIKTGDVTVAPIDPMDVNLVPDGKGGTSSLQSLYETEATHAMVSNKFKILMFTMDPKNKAALGAQLVADGVDPTKPTDAQALTAIGEIMAKVTP